MPQAYWKKQDGAILFEQFDRENSLNVRESFFSYE